MASARRVERPLARMAQTVLVIDDSEIVHAVIEQRLAPDGVRVVHALDSRSGLAAANADPPDLVLLDLDLPDMSGFEVCHALKESPVTRAIPVIFLTASTDVAAKVRGFDAGAVDYVSKDADPAEMRARVRAALRTKRFLDLLAARAEIDGLTGLWNRGYFDRRLEEEVAAARRYDRTVSLVLLDIDHFKRVNDERGHPTGDFVLQRIGELVLGAVRAVDSPCRYGGEEIAIVLPETSLVAAGTMSERMRAAIAELVFETDEGRFSTTASFGVASTELFGAAGDATAEGLLRATDVALYRAKGEGRNRVAVADAIPSAGRPSLGGG